MLKGALLRQKSRMLITAATVALGASLATAMLDVMLDVGDKVNQELKTYGANLSVVPKGVSFIGDLYGVEEDENSEKYLAEDDLPKLKTIFWAFNIVDFAPYLDAAASVRGRGGAVEARIVGTWFDKHLDIPTGESVDTGISRMKSWWDVSGAWAKDDVGDGEIFCMTGTKLAAELGISPGDKISVAGDRPVEITVAGVFKSGGDEDDVLFVPLGVAQNISGKRGLVNRIEVSALTTPENDLARRAAQNPNSLSRHEWDTWYCTAYISSIAYQIEEVISGARAKPILQVASSEGAILEKTQMLMLLLTILSLASSALALSNLVTAGVMERSAQIGLLEAIGASSREVSLLIISETLISALIGGCAGYFAGIGFAQIIGHTVFGSTITAHPLVIPLVVLLVTAVTLAGSLPAIRLLMSLRPAEVLHGR
jgi:putative ABC transport system permease protein